MRRGSNEQAEGDGAGEERGGGKDCWLDRHERARSECDGLPMNRRKGTEPERNAAGIRIVGWIVMNEPGANATGFGGRALIVWAPEVLCSPHIRSGLIANGSLVILASSLVISSLQTSSGPLLASRTR